MKYLTTAASQPEVETIRSLLQSAGIVVVVQALEQIASAERLDDGTP